MLLAAMLVLGICAIDPFEIRATDIRYRRPTNAQLRKRPSWQSTSTSKKNPKRGGTQLPTNT